jgi:hypothetical protein
MEIFFLIYATFLGYDLGIVAEGGGELKTLMQVP